MTYEFNDYLLAFLLTLFAGLATAIGAIIAFFSDNKNDKLLSFGLSFSAGVMIYVSFIEIIPKSKDAFTAIFTSNTYLADTIAMITFFVGLFFTYLIDSYIPKDINPHQPRKDFELSQLKQNNLNSVLTKSTLRRTGIFTAIAISIHNFPEGFATFVSSLDSFELGLTIALAIALHNIPEGLAVSLPIYHSTGDKKKAFKLAALSGLAEPIGAIIGFAILYPFMGEYTLGITFGIVAGIMVYISFDELLPAARTFGNAKLTMLGLTSGMFVMALSLLLFQIQ